MVKGLTHEINLFLPLSFLYSSESLHTLSLWCCRRPGHPDTVEGQEKSHLLSYCLHNQWIFQWVGIQLPLTVVTILATANLILPFPPDVLLSYAFTIYEIVKLSDGETVQSKSHQITTSSFLLYIFQVSKTINKPVLWIAVHLFYSKLGLSNCTGIRTSMTCQAKAGPFLSLTCQTYCYLRLSYVCVLVTRLDCNSVETISHCHDRLWACKRAQGWKQIALWLPVWSPYVFPEHWK